MEEIREVARKLLEIEKEKSKNNENRIKEIERSLKNSRDIQQKKNLENEKKNLEKETISYQYKLLLKKLTEFLIKENLSSISIDEFIGPDGICQAIAKGLTFKRTQLRKFFNEVKTIKIKLNSNPEDRSIKTRLVALVPKLAYSHGKKLIDENFYEFMKLLITKLKDDFTPENFEKFEQIFEAIIAYHVYYNPKEE